MGRINYIENLLEFESFLKNGTYFTNEEQKRIPLYYIDENGGYILYDGNVPYFHKVPELSSPRFLMQAKLMEVLNNRYIPIIDRATKELVFTEQEFKELRSKMAGLKTYNAGPFEFSENLYFPGIEEYLDVIDENFAEIEKQRTAIYKTISKIIGELGFTLSEDAIELIDTGSTARGSNIPTRDTSTKWDFDFIMKIDKEDRERVKTALVNNLNSSLDRVIARHRIRLKDVEIEGLQAPVDIDVSFVPKKDKYLGTETALKERLDTIKEQDEEKYRLVLANIMHAKKMLKKYQAYKPYRSDKTQGGLGGVGIENWILQHGGSFKDAAEDFLRHAVGKEFIEFESTTPIYDFGQNHISVAKGIFPYDNFVMKNMRENGFINMQKCLLEFLKELQLRETLTEGPKLS